MSDFATALLAAVRGQSVSQVGAQLGALKNVVTAVEAAWAEHGRNVSADLDVAEKLAEVVAMLPIPGVQQDAALAAKGLKVLEVVVRFGTPHNSGEGGIGDEPEGNSNNISIGA